MNPKPEVLLPDGVPIVHSIRFESRAAEEVSKAVMKKKGDSGPSGLDTDGWQKILTSN